MPYIPGDSKSTALNTNSFAAITLLASAFTLVGCTEDKQDPRLEITIVGDQYEAGDNTLISQLVTDPGGSTSIRNTSEGQLVWKSQGYYQRNRDLGQVFYLHTAQELSAVILRTGPSDKAVLSGAPGSELFLQFYQVEGEPRINDNGTPVGTDALHGFSTNHRCDDFIEGIHYRPLEVYRGGKLPGLPPTFDSGGATRDSSGNLQFLRFSMEPPLELPPGRYAFMVGFTQPGEMRGITLANANRASLPDTPELGDRHDLYPDGWGLRREGSGKVPPTMLESSQEPTDPTVLQNLRSESLFPVGKERFGIPPTTDGYPDVDTYRDLTFAIEVKQ